MTTSIRGGEHANAAGSRVACSMVSAAVASLALAVPACGEVKLPAIFGHNMVLQQNRDVPVWGWAAPGEKITVSFAGRQAAATADGQGRWKTRGQQPRRLHERRGRRGLALLRPVEHEVRSLRHGPCAGGDRERELSADPPLRGPDVGRS